MDRLTFEGLDQAERIRVGHVLIDFLDVIGGENATLDAAHRHEAAERERHFNDATQKEHELRTLRGVAAQCKGEVAELTDAAMRLCDLLASRLMTADEADSVAELRKAMKGSRAREYAAAMKDSVRKFEALTIMRRMLRKLRVNDDLREAAEKWARKQLRL